jgi:hypothetical protein
MTAALTSTSGFRRGRTVNRQTLFGMFGLLTLILAGATIARLAGLPLDAALYLSALGMLSIGYIRYQRGLRGVGE